MISFSLNYPEFPDSCLGTKLFVIKDCLKVLVDRADVGFLANFYVRLRGSVVEEIRSSAPCHRRTPITRSGSSDMCFRAGDDLERGGMIEPPTASLLQLRPDNADA